MESAAKVEESTSLTDLPIELQTAIVRASGWKEALGIRTTCHSLNAVSRTKHVWVHFLEPYTSPPPESPAPILRLERPLKDYSAADLENLVLRIKRTEDVWTGKTSAVSQQAVEIASSEYFSHACLVPGGRWLLVFRTTGLVTYYDLDLQTEMKEEILIHTAQQQQQQSHISPAIHTSHPDIQRTSDSEILTFNISIVTSFGGMDEDGRSSVQMWKITLTSNHSSKPFTRLDAHRLSAFTVPHPRQDELHSVSLLDSNLALAFFPTEDVPHRSSYAIVLNWTHFNPSEAARPPMKMMSFKNPSGWGFDLRLLPDHRLFLCYGKVCRIFNYNDFASVRAISNLGLEEPTEGLLWERRHGHGDQYNFENCSQLYFCPGSIRFTVNLFGPQRALDVFGVVIDTSGTTGGFDPYRLVHLTNVVSDLQFDAGHNSLGYDHAVFVKNKQALLVSYEWPNDTSQEVRTTLGTEIALRNASDLDNSSGDESDADERVDIVMDERCGRILYSGGHQLNLVDLASLQYAIDNYSVPT